MITTAAQQHLETLTEWFAEQWGEVSITSQHNHVQVPAPLVAIDNAGTLIGGLAFTTAPSPLDGTAAAWINAVLVTPEQRGRGIADQLIGAAEQAMKDLHAAQLFAFTDVPALYAKRGWQLLSQDGNDHVMHKTLN